MRKLDYFEPSALAAEPAGSGDSRFRQYLCHTGGDANMVYAAAKRGLESYLSLRHAFSDSDVLIQFYVLGYLETNLSFGIPTMLPKGDVGKAGGVRRLI